MVALAAFVPFRHYGIRVGDVRAGAGARTIWRPPFAARWHIRC